MSFKRKLKRNSFKKHNHVRKNLAFKMQYRKRFEKVIKK